jgi:hypothetical protein
MIVYSQGLSVAEEIRELPSSLRTDVLMHLHVHDLRQNPVFGIASDDLLKKISTRLTIQVKMTPPMARVSVI